MKVGVVDIGTNSMRLLVTDGQGYGQRWVEVTGLGRSVDRTGSFEERAVGDTLRALSAFGETMTKLEVERRAAIATSASRDVADASSFLGRASELLGVEPRLIGGDVEGRLAFEGATMGSNGRQTLVSDIGGGSTEFVTRDSVVSIDVGSVRLTERHLRDRPAEPKGIEESLGIVLEMFESVQLREPHVLGVAGTWTSLAAMSLDLQEYDEEIVNGRRISKEALWALTEKLAGLSGQETARSFPSLDPRRSGVILAGAVIARAVVEHLGVDGVEASVYDSLDGLARRTLDLA